MQIYHKYDIFPNSDNYLATTPKTQMETLNINIHRIVTGFENGTLPKAEWTHEAHLIMALWYAVHLPKDKVLPTIRAGIIRYNEAVGTANTATSGYHETLTVFYVQVVMRFLSNTDRTLPISTLTEMMLQSEIADRAFSLRFYSKEFLFSPEVRARWHVPDMRALDESL